MSCSAKRDPNGTWHITVSVDRLDGNQEEIPEARV